MGKDRNGNFFPQKGRPSGSGKETTGLRDAFAVINPDADNIISDKYTDGPDQPSANVPVRHKNRNVNKGEEGANRQE